MGTVFHFRSFPELCVVLRDLSIKNAFNAENAEFSKYAENHFYKLDFRQHKLDTPKNLYISSRGFDIINTARILTLRPAPPVLK